MRREREERERERRGRDGGGVVFPACVFVFVFDSHTQQPAADVCHLLSLSFSLSVQQQKIIPGSFGAQKEQIFMTKVQVRRPT